jgi:hypothetical protein
LLLLDELWSEGGAGQGADPFSTPPQDPFSTTPSAAATDGDTAAAAGGSNPAVPASNGQHPNGDLDALLALDMGPPEQQQQELDADAAAPQEAVGALSTASQAVEVPAAAAAAPPPPPAAELFDPLNAARAPVKQASLE